MGRFKAKDLKYETNKYILHMIFNNLKQKELLVIIFILAKLVWMKLRWIKAVFGKIQQYLIINLEQKKEDKRKKGSTIDSISVLYEGQELTLNAFRSGIFLIKKKKKIKKRIENIKSKNKCSIDQQQFLHQ